MAAVQRATASSTPRAPRAPKPPKPSKMQVRARRNLQALQEVLPDLTQSINEQLAPTEQARLEALRGVIPQYGELEREQTRLNAESLAQTDSDLINGIGGQNVLDALELDKQLNPEYYSLRENTSRVINDQLNNPLSEGERVEIERGVNRLNEGRGQADIQGAGTTAKNATIFGSAARQKLDKAIQSSTNFTPITKSGDAFSQATGRAGQGNQLGQFSAKGTAGITDPGVGGDLNKDLYDLTNTYVGAKNANQPIKGWQGAQQILGSVGENTDY